MEIIKMISFFFDYFHFNFKFFLTPIKIFFFFFFSLIEMRTSGDLILLFSYLLYYYFFFFKNFCIICDVLVYFNNCGNFGCWIFGASSASSSFRWTCRSLLCNHFYLLSTGICIFSSFTSAYFYGRYGARGNNFNFLSIER